MALLIVWIALTAIAAVWVLQIAFRQSAGWGVLILVFPPAGIVFALLHWDECKLPFLLYVVAAALAIYQVKSDPVALLGGDLEVVRDRARRVAEAVEQYKAAQGQRPAGIAALVEGGYLTAEEAQDPWGSQLRITRYRGKLVVWCLGEDKAEKGGDDISFSF